MNIDPTPDHTDGLGVLVLLIGSFLMLVVTVIERIRDQGNGEPTTTAATVQYVPSNSLTNSTGLPSPPAVNWLQANPVVHPYGSNVTDKGFTGWLPNCEFGLRMDGVVVWRQVVTTNSALVLPENP